MQTELNKIRQEAVAEERERILKGLDDIFIKTEMGIDYPVNPYDEIVSIIKTL